MQQNDLSVYLLTRRMFAYIAKLKKKKKEEREKKKKIGKSLQTMQGK